MAKKKKKAVPAVSPEMMKARKDSLRRTNRQVVYLNDSEMAAVREYCERFKVKSVSTVFREATIERILTQLDNCHPTLF